MTFCARLSLSSSRRTIYSEAFDKVRMDPTISYALGSPAMSSSSARHMPHSRMRSRLPNAQSTWSSNW